MSRFHDVLSLGSVLVLDSGQGTRLIARGLDLAIDDPSTWVLDHPDEVARLHAEDVAAGADIVLSCTFGANATTLARYGRASDVEAVNRTAVGLARDAGPSLVFGSVGPNPVAGSVCLRQVKALCDAGVDAILLETYQFLPACVALSQIVSAVGPVPVLVSLWNWTGIDPARLVELGASGLGINCMGIENALVTLQSFVPTSTVPWLFKPDAGCLLSPPVSSENFTRAVHEAQGLGVRMIGGCCGTTSEHVALIRRAVSSKRDSCSNTGDLAPFTF